MGLIEILINTLADMSGADDAAAGLDNLEEQSDGASDSSDELGGSLGDLNGILGAIGLTVSAGAMLNLAVQLNAAGAAANRVNDTFDAFTGGKADEYATAVQGAVHGLIDDEDALVVSQSLLNQGMARNSAEAAELVRNATILGSAFSNIGAKQAAEDFARLLETLSPRQMREFGITIDEVTGKTKELMAANSDLTERQANQQAIMEIASQKAGQLSGVLDDQKAHLDALAISWANLGETIGGTMSNEFDPAVVGLNNLIVGLTGTIQKTSEMKSKAIELSGSFTEFEQNWRAITEAELGYAVANTVTQAQFDASRAAFVAANFEARDYIQTQIFGTGAAADQAAAARDQAAAVEELRAAEERRAIVLAQQTGLQLGILSQIEQLTDGTQGLAGVFDTANQLLSGYQLTQEQQLVMYEQLGLATGQVTLAEIDQANQLRQLTNEYVAGQIGAEAYAGALEHVKSGGDSAFLALATLEKSITDQGVAMSKSGDDLDKFVTSHLNEATKAAGDTEQEMKDIQTEAAKVGAIDVKPMVRADEIIAATDRTIELMGALAGIPETININVNYTTTGNAPPGVEPGSP